MDLICTETICLHMLYLAVSTSCNGSNAMAEQVLQTLGTLSRFRTHTASRLLPVQDNPTQQEEGPGHKTQRIRRSWLSDYLDDLWAHIRHSFPRAALYAFPVVLVIMLILCCVTVLLE